VRRPWVIKPTPLVTGPLEVARLGTNIQSVLHNFEVGECPAQHYTAPSATQRPALHSAQCHTAPSIAQRPALHSAQHHPAPCTPWLEKPLPTLTSRKRDVEVVNNFYYQL